MSKSCETCQQVKAELEFRSQGEKRSRVDKYLAASERALLKGTSSMVLEEERVAMEMELRNIQDANRTIIHVRALSIRNTIN